MKLEDLILVSVDDHAIEPPNAFKHHMPEKFKGREPHVEKRGDRDVWVFEESGSSGPKATIQSLSGRLRASGLWLQLHPSF